MKISGKMLFLLLFVSVIGLFWGVIFRAGSYLVARYAQSAWRVVLPAASIELEADRIALQRDEIALRRANISARRNNIARNDAVSFAAAVGALSVTGLCALVVSSAHARAVMRRASIYMIKIGQHTEFPVHIRQIKQGALAEQLTALTTAEQLRAYSDGQQRAFEIYQALAETQLKHLRALPDTLTPLLDVTPPAAPRTVPSFAEMLRAGVIAPGKPMILGYVNGVARPGSFLDIYSAAIAGASGSGKTGTLLYLIGSGIVAEQVRFYGIDPHYPHPKSLGFKTKPLWDAGVLKMATYLDDMLAILREVEATIDHRLQQHDTATTPVVLVIDELAFLAKSSIGGQIAHTMERIATEGRKCAVYLLASSQTWLVARTGDSSVVRDTLTSAFVHRIKPKQANLLLQDKDEAEKVKRFVKHPGDVLLCPVNDESVVCQMPLTTDADMARVVDLTRGQYTVNKQVVDQPVDQPVDRAKSGVDLVDRVNAMLKNNVISWAELVEKTGLDAGFLSKILHGKKALPAARKPCFEMLVEMQADTRHGHATTETGDES